MAAAEELHFGKAAQRLEMLPSALGRHIRLLEDDLGTSLLARTTRSVSLTEDGVAFLEQARDLLAQAERLAVSFRARGRALAKTIRIGAIDSAAAGLLPALLHDLHERSPDVAIKLVEDKTIRLLPRILSGRLDVAIVRPPETADKRLEFQFLFHETAVVAVPEGHPLAKKKRLSVSLLAQETLIVPDRRSRPHSHDLTTKLFAEAGLSAHTVQIADEKQTIVNLVAAGLGVAIVPRWTSRMTARGVSFVPLKMSDVNRLPLAIAWLRGTRDPVRDELLDVLTAKLSVYSREA